MDTGRNKVRLAPKEIVSMWVILASGQSLSREQVAYCLKARAEKKIKGIIAVSNVGIDLCPEADALVSHDSNWWRAYPEALQFKGKRFSARGYRDTCQYHPYNAGFLTGMNSGLMAMYVARDRFDAKKLLLLGFDMHGTHYFGKHPESLFNTNEQKFKKHIKQFEQFSGCEVINCTAGSSLKIFPSAEIYDII